MLDALGSPAHRSRGTGLWVNGNPFKLAVKFERRR